MSNNNESNGVLDKEYADGRLKKKELIFRYKTRSQLIVNYVNKYLISTGTKRILDFGAAEGLAMLELDRLLPGHYITGVEYSKDLINRAPIFSDNIKLVNGDVTNLSDDVKREKYDVVVALALLEHLKNPLESLKQAKDVLNNNGIFIATSPNPFWDNVSTKLGLLRDDQHQIEMTKQAMIKLAKDADFEVLEYGRFMWAPISVLPYFGIKISPSWSLKIDKFIKSIYLFDWLFVNQVIVLKKND